MQPTTRPLIPALIFVAACSLHFFFVTVGWRHGMLPGHEFRQAQTGLSTYFIQQENNYSLAYPTPVLGKPWSVPMEFPLYQWSVARLNDLTGGPLYVSARVVSLTCFYLCLPALWLLLSRLRIAVAGRWLALAYVVACPLYIFYSRAFLIESMALAFALWCLAALTAGLRNLHAGWLTAAAIFGMGAVLVKVTTAMLILGPLGVFLMARLGISRRSAVDRGLAVRRLGVAALALTPALIVGVWWIRLSDSIKSLNPSGAVLTSGSLREYHFGTLAERVSPDHWSQWLHHVGHGVAGRLVLAGALLAIWFVPKRTRWLAVGGFAVFALGPAVFPRLYAMHEYYFYASSAFLACTIGLVASGLLASRVPRSLAWLAIIAGLAFQFQLYRTHYLPQQRIDSSGTTGLTQLLSLLTAPNDVLVVAGHDWDSILPYTSRRRALMIRRGLEHDQAYLERAFADLHGESVAVLILAGETRENRALIDLAVKTFSLNPEPFLSHHDDVVYVNKKLFDEWSVRVPSAQYTDIRVLNRNEHARPLLTGSPSDVHGQDAFANMHPFPSRFDVPFGLATYWSEPHRLFNAHAPTHLWFELKPGAHQLRLEFGILDSAWKDESGHTDGVEFVLNIEHADGRLEPVWQRFLNPWDQPADRGPQMVQHDFALPVNATLKLSMLPGPHGSNAFDWAYLSSLRLD